MKQKGGGLMLPPPKKEASLSSLLGFYYKRKGIELERAKIKEVEVKLQLAGGVIESFLSWVLKLVRFPERLHYKLVLLKANFRKINLFEEKTQYCPYLVTC